MTTENTNTLDVQTARKIRELFGSCSSLYECHTVQELIADFAEMVAENPATTLEYWLGVQLSIEDAFGTSSAMIAEIRNRLRPYWTPVKERPRITGSHATNREVIANRGQIGKVCYICGRVVTRGTDYPADAEDAAYIGNDPGALLPHVIDLDGHAVCASFVESCEMRNLLTEVH